MEIFYDTSESINIIVSIFQVSTILTNRDENLKPHFGPKDIIIMNKAGQLAINRVVPV